MTPLSRPHRPRLSISARLTLWYGLTMLVLLTLFALSCYAYMHQSIHRDFDRHLTHEKMQLIPLVRTDGKEPRMEPADARRTAAYHTDGVFGTYVRLIRSDGREVFRSPNFVDHDPLAIELPGERREVFLSREWEDKPARTMYTPLRGPRGSHVGWLEITGFEWSLHQDLHRLAQALTVGIALSVLLSIAGGYLLARRALLPVAALTDAARDIRATDLSSRLPTRFGVQDELTDLAETFNEMIARLEASFVRERRFTANAAHELLTPLATMRNEVEVTLRRDRGPEEYRRTLGALTVDIGEMTEMVQGLLQLSHAERLQDLPRMPVDLSLVVEEHLARFSDRAADQDQLISSDVQPGVCVLADATRIGEVVDNLIDNALKYTPTGERVVVQVRAADGEARLTVQDTGIGFDPPLAAQLFDRFYRSDAPEVQARAGSGLGLAIVKTIVEAYGGRVSASSEGPQKGSRFEVRLPLGSKAGC